MQSVRQKNFTIPPRFSENLSQRLIIFLAKFYTLERYVYIYVRLQN